MNPLIPTSRPSAAQIIEQLHLQPHPEGGFFRETYRSDEQIAAEALAERYPAARSISTAIYYMLTADTFSTMHLVQSDEIYHFYAGAPLEVLLLLPDGTYRSVIVGPDPTSGQQPQLVIPHGWWQGSRVFAPGEYSLIGATVAPGFDFADFKIGTQAELSAKWPAAADKIAALTRT
jgi:predicted cupin superfamily sugar epimerase